MTEADQQKVTHWNDLCNEDEFGQILHNLDSAISFLREFVWRRGGLKVAQQNMESIDAAQSDLAEIVFDIRDTMIRAAE